MDNDAHYDENVTLDPESFRCRQIYAFFGVTMYYIQCLEKTLAMLGATVYNPNADKISRDDYDIILKKNFTKSLGQMITQIKKSVDLPDDFEKKLADALKKRNFVAHHYFWNRAMKMSYTQGQEEIIAELSQLSTYFQEMDKELDSVLRKWGNAKGVTDTYIHKVMGDMFLSEIKDINDEEAVKQVMNTLIYQVLDDAISNNR